MTPAKIINNYPNGEQFGRVPLNALPALNINLTDRERKLLQFYICQKTGFAPSAKTIEQYTGISPKKLSETRKGLEKVGFIQLKNIRGKEDREVVINWDKILENSKALLMSANILDSDPAYMGSLYPRCGKKKPYREEKIPDTVGIIYNTSAFDDYHKSIGYKLDQEWFHAKMMGAEIKPDFEGYHESGQDKFEHLTEPQIEKWLDDGLPF